MKNPSLRSLLCLLSTGLFLAGTAGAAEVGVKSLSGPPAEFENHTMPGSEDLVVATNLLKPDWQSAGTHAVRGAEKAIQSSNFSTTSGVGFTVVQVTTSYPSFAPLTLTAPNGTTYYFNGSTLTCNGGPCASDQADLEIESFSANTGGAAAVSISGGQVTGGSWNLAEQTTPILTLAQGKAAVQIDSTLGFDDNVVEVTIDPDPCGVLALRHEPADVLREKLELCPLKSTPRSSFDLVAGATPVFAISGYSMDESEVKVARRLDLTDLRVSLTDANLQKVAFERTYGLNEVAALPLNAEGHSLVSLPPLAPGRYSVRLDIEGVLEGVGKIERTAFYFLPIEPQSHRLTGTVRASILDQTRLELGLGVEELGPGFAGKEMTHLYAYAEVWSADGQTPIAWIGGMTQPRIDSLGEVILPLDFDARWLALAGKRDFEYRLRNVRIQDPDTFVMLHELVDVPFAVDRLPKAASEPVTKAVLADETLLKGRADKTLDLPDLDSLHRPTKTGLDTGIFLVHGWCSQPTWNAWMFDPTGLVGGTDEFSDPMQSRSHDNFAQRIRTQGDACFDDSFSVVAHSQGGAASVHLLTFYTSGLDFSAAPRRIQTMGTPYGGSTLMDLFIAAGPLAWLIAEIIGDCTPQVNLSTLGAALWRTGIPNWARDDVFYYRTRHTRPGNFWQRLQFWRWRCNIASFVIPGNDDGVVSINQGNFNNANNMGIRDGQCHTGGMNHPDQKDDTARNDIMNEEGRPDPPPPVDANCQVQAFWRTGGPTGNGYYEYWVDGSGSTGSVSEYRWRNGGGAWGPWSSTHTSYGPLFPGLPGQASNYFIWLEVRDNAGNTSGAGCSVP